MDLFGPQEVKKRFHWRPIAPRRLGPFRALAADKWSTPSFLDETVGDIPPALQPKLLRVPQETGISTILGSNQTAIT